MPQGSLTVALEETLSAFDGVGTPATTTEVAERLDLGRRSAYERLERLVDHGRIETMKVGANGRVWWQPATEPAASNGTRVESQQTETASDREDADREREREQYETIVETVTDGVCAADAEYRFTMVNDAYVDMVGYSREELLGSHISLVIDEETVALGEKRRERMRAGIEDAGSAELEIETADGERLTVESRYAPIPTDGEFAGTVGVVRDVSERKRLERELRIEKEHFRVAVEHSPLTVFRLDTDLRYTWIANPHEDFDPASVIGKRDDELLPAAAAETIMEPKQRALETGECVREEVTYELPSGRMSYDLTVEPLRDESGEVVGLTATSLNITEREQRERDLEASERRFRSVFEKAFDAILLADDDGEYVAANPAAAELLGVDREALLGRSITEFVPDEYDFEEVWATFADEGELRGTVPILRPDGDERIAEFDARANVLPGRHLSILRDVTERVEHERERSEQREKLAALNHLHGVVRSVTTAVIEQSSREEIEQIVCEHLADSDSYDFAWIGEADTDSKTIRVRADAGLDGYLDDLELTIDPADARSSGPAARALRTGDLQTINDVDEELAFADWRERVDEFDVRSIATIPITHDESVYGVLCVYAPRPDAFTGDERVVVSQLGDIVGHAITAIERKRALTSDQITEVVLQQEGILDSLGIEQPAEGAITIDQSIPVGKDEYLFYGSVTENCIETFEAFVETFPRWDDLHLSSEGSGPATFDVRLTNPPALSLIAGRGGSVEEARFEAGNYEMTVHLPRGSDVRAMMEVVRESYPSMNVVAQRQKTRESGEATKLHRTVGDELTDRQRAVLDVAFYSGFFEWPRMRTAEELAETLGISAPTFHQHLRKAQHKVITALYD